MIRTLTIAAAAATVGYALGQRASDDPEHRFSRPEVTGDDVVVDDGEIGLSDPFVDSHRNMSWKPPEGYDPFDHRHDDDGDGRIGQ